LRPAMLCERIKSTSWHRAPRSPFLTHRPRHTPTAHPHAALPSPLFLSFLCVATASFTSRATTCRSGRRL
jgi:hypothetical protein